MQYRLDPKTGNKLSVLAFGCMRFPRGLTGFDFKKTESLVLNAVKRGVNYFDTAYIYGNSEEVLGQIVKKHNLRDKIYIASKLPLILCKKPSDIDKFFDKQLKRLQTDHIDYYLLHMVTEVKQWEKFKNWGIEEWIQKKKETGQIRQIGFSFHGIQKEFLELLDAYDWDFCMMQYNYSDENYQAGIKGLKKASEKGLPVMIMEPLLGGKLANGLPKSAVNIFKKANPDLTPAAWGLRWVWNQPEVTTVLSGMNTSAQLSDNLKTAKSAKADMLTKKEMTAYKLAIKALNASYKVRCTGCNYCMPCPHNVNIPACFTAYNLSFSLGKMAGMEAYMTSTGGVSGNKHFASLCKKCGKCEIACPQNIAIIKSLNDVQKKMEPFWYHPLLGLARTILGNNSYTKM